MKTIEGHDYDSDDEAGDKLIPEWRVNENDQIIVAGVAVFAAIVLIFGWQLWRTSGETDLPGVATTTTAEAKAVDPSAEVPIVAPAVNVGATGDEVAGPTTSVTADAATTSSSTQPSEVVAADTVQSVLDTLPGVVIASTDGSSVTLEGFVANQGESDNAETAALRVAGVEAVDNRLVILEPAVEQALSDAGVINAAARGVGTDVTIQGTIAAEDDRQPSVEAAQAVPGVTGIDDRLTLSVTAELNELPQVKFATGSAQILPESFPDLDTAAALLNDSGGASVEIQGYTDIVGEETANQRLSEDRANAVRQYLIDNGDVDEGLVSAVGYGETEQFAEGDSAESLAQNRLVRFVELG